MRRYLLSPEAAQDIARIWRHLCKEAGQDVAQRVETTIRDQIAFLARNPGAGHTRKDLTKEDVKFFAVFSYLIVYRPVMKPLQVVAILHGGRDVEQVLKGRF